MRPQRDSAHDTPMCGHGLELHQPMSTFQLSCFQIITGLVTRLLLTRHRSDQVKCLGTAAKGSAHDKPVCAHALNLHQPMS